MLGSDLKNQGAYSYLWACQMPTQERVIWADADHSGCRRSRESSSGGVVMWGERFAGWGSVPSVVAPSSEWGGLRWGG
eukprot:1259360-Pyramimonas_sp.AAC.1